MRKFLAVASLVIGFALPAQAVELVIVEQPGCHSCKQWNLEIAPIYPKTEAGMLAPLRREQLRKKPDDLTYARAVNYTPTFLIVENGQELARLEGYPGEDFFWWHIENLLAEHAGFQGATK